MDVEKLPISRSSGNGPPVFCPRKRGPGVNGTVGKLPAPFRRVVCSGRLISSASAGRLGRKSEIRRGFDGSRVALIESRGLERRYVPLGRDKI